MNPKTALAAQCAMHIVRGCVALTLSSAALAQTTLYRCGAEGHSYSQAPCSHGRAVMVDDARSADQRQHAQIQAQRELATAQQMRVQRLADEARFKPAGPAGIRYPAADAARVAHKPSGEERADKRSRKSHDKRQVHKDPRVTWQVKLPAPKKEKASSRATSVKR